MYGTNLMPMFKIWASYVNIGINIDIQTFHINN